MRVFRIYRKHQEGWLASEWLASSSLYRRAGESLAVETRHPFAASVHPHAKRFLLRVTEKQHITSICIAASSVNCVSELLPLCICCNYR
jgi:hypothetical protein